MIAAKQARVFTAPAQATTNASHQSAQPVGGHLLSSGGSKSYETRSEKKATEAMQDQHITDSAPINRPAPLVRKQLNVGHTNHLASTSPKIQQRQQKFLAAAARSATSPSSSSPSAAAAAASGTASRQQAPGAVSQPASQDSHQIHQPQSQQQSKQQQQHHQILASMKPPKCCCQSAACAGASSLSPSSLQQKQQQESPPPPSIQPPPPPPTNATPAPWQAPSTPQSPQQQQQATMATPTNQQRQQSHLMVAHTLQRHYQFNNSNVNNNNNNYHNHHHHHHLPHHHQQQQHHNQQQPTPTTLSQQHLQQQHHLQYQHHHDLQQQHQQQQQQNTMDHYKFHNDCQSSVLTYEQVKRLDFVMDQAVPIHGRGNFPTLYVKLKELIRLVKYKLQKEHMIEIRDVILNGGASNYVLAPENSHYNDLDLIFGTDLSDESRFDVIRDVVLECLKEFLPHEHNAKGEAEEDEKPVGEPAVEGVEEEDNDDDVTYNHFSDEEQQHQRTNDLTASESESATKVAPSRDGDSFELPPHEQHSANKNQSSQQHAMASDGVSVSCGDEARVGGDDDICGNNGNNGETVGPGSGANTKNSKVLQSQKTANTISATRTISKANNNSVATDANAHNPPIAPTTNFHQQQSYQMPLSNCAIKEAYVHKMVKVNDDDRWSLISLGVQQSEGNYCGQTNSCSPALGVVQQADTRQLQPHRQFSVTLTYEDEPNGFNNQSTGPMGSFENHNLQTITSNNMQRQQVTYLHHQHKNQRNHYQQQQQKQFPNSIELKFVDRMRRKFEFSVDSFQIILDSLIQFYDYAPQSTITKLMNSHPSSTMINTRPLINKRRCSEFCTGRLTNDCKTNDNSGSLRGSIINNKENFNYHNHHTNHQNNISGAKSILNSSRSYYQLPVEPANSSSISSMASSSGCSSSSSVVSSSSSSLSCDEDQEDLYCDADGPPSSSASTSSLLSSTAMSLLSSDSTCGVSEPEHQKSRLPSKQQERRNFKESTRKLVDANGIGRNNSMANNSSDLVPYKLDPIDCIECFDKQECVKVNDFDFGTDLGSCAVISENFYPTVIGRSEYGNFKEALYHLEKKLIATRSPEEIRGGGLLKYCNLLVKNYKPTNVYQIRTLERYMCSRFFIDFSDLNQQQAKLESYLANHFSDDPMLKFDYLTILHNVVQRSTVCLMNHELRLTLNMIRDLAYKLSEQQQHNQYHQQQQHQHHHQHTQVLFSRK